MTIDLSPLNSLGSLRDGILQVGLTFVVRILSAILLWLLGRWLIGLALRLARRGLRLRRLDLTVVAYIASSIDVVLTMLLLIAMLSVFGIETTSFAALFAAAGVAIGVAWAGLLSHFAAGVFLLLIRPFKVGDVVHVSEHTGTVKEIGLFGTTIATFDNVLTIVPNNKVFGETIQNFSAMPYRRVDINIKIPHRYDPHTISEALKPRIAQIANVLADPAMMIDVIALKSSGTVMAVRPCCATEHYGQVLRDTNHAVRLALVEMGIWAD